MAAFMLSLVFFLAISSHSSASYCICKDGVNEKVLQENIDYACGSGADCTAIHQNGACYNPNTIKDHCNYAVNSYYQRKGASGATCDFKGTATLSSSAPASTGSGCVYQSTAGNTGGSTTPTTAPGTMNPSTGGTSTSTGAGTGMGTGTGATTTIPGTNPVFGLGPSGITNTDMNGAYTIHQSSVFFTMALLFTSLVCLRV